MSGVNSNQMSGWTHTPDLIQLKSMKTDVNILSSNIYLPLYYIANWREKRNVHSIFVEWIFFFFFLFLNKKRRNIQVPLDCTFGCVRIIWMKNSLNLVFKFRKQVFIAKSKKNLFINIFLLVGKLQRYLKWNLLTSCKTLYLRPDDIENENLIFRICTFIFASVFIGAMQRYQVSSNSARLNIWNGFSMQNYR